MARHQGSYPLMNSVVRIHLPEPSLHSGKRDGSLTAELLIVDQTGGGSNPLHRAIL
jgi:hypothetical protein